MAAPDMPAVQYRFEDLRLDLGRRRLWRGNEVIPLTKLSFEFLRALVEAAPNVVASDALVAQVWGRRRIITPENLNQRLRVLRRSLGDDAAHPRYVESVRGHGFRLIPPVERVAAGIVPAPRTWRERLAARGWTVAAICLLVLMGAFALTRDPSSVTPAARTVAAAALVDAPVPHSVAILPFQILGPVPDGEYLGEALHAELINALGKVEGLNVVARASVQRYSGLALPLDSIARNLGVETIVQGSIRYTGDRAQILAELIDPVTGMQLWNDAYGAGLEEIFTIRAAMTRGIANALEAAAPTDGDGLEQLPTRSAEAFAFYMRAMDVFGSDTYGSRTAAQTFLDQAIVLDPEFAHAYAGKGLVHVYSAINSVDGAVEGSAGRDDETLALEYIEAALRLNSDTDLAYFARALLHMYARRWAAAEGDFERALELTPQHIEFLSRYGWFRACLLRDAGGLRYTERAVALDPENPRVHEVAADTLGCTGDREAALEALRRALELDPTRFMQRLSLALSLSRTGATREALQALENLEPLLTDRRVLALPAVALAYAELGRNAAARRIFDRFVALAESRRVGPANWVYAYLAIRDRDNALRALDEAARELAPGPGFLTLMAIRNNSRSLPVLDEPAFAELRERLDSID